MKMTKEDYNNEPVFYCASCFSLGIKILEDIKVDICLDCGNTDIKTTSYDEYNKAYVNQLDTVDFKEVPSEED